MSKLTPPQAALLRKLRDVGATGLPIDQIRGTAADKTLTGLARRQLVTISFGRAYARPEQT